jgi:hypothetical protein
MPQAPVEFKDVLVEPRYDTAVIITGTSILNLFQNPIGQGVGAFGAAGVAKTLADTNMDLPGQLPSGYFFKIKGFRMATTWNLIGLDFGLMFNGCVFQFVVGSKAFLTVPARTIPAGNGPWASGSNVAAATAAFQNSGWPSMQNGFTTSLQPLDLKPTENFKVVLTWPGVTPTITQTGFIPTPGAPVTVYLDGFLYRPVQ